MSATGEGRIYFDSTTNQFLVSSNGSAFVSLAGALQSAYAGGNTIATAPGVPVVFGDANADATDVLQVNKTPTATNAGAGITVTMGSNATGPGLVVSGTNLSNASIYVGNGTSNASPVDGAIRGTAASGGNNTGGGVQILAGTGNGGGAGGAVTIRPGDGGQTGSGGPLIVIGGGGGATSGGGGAVNITGGGAATSGGGGAVNIAGGPGRGAASGNVTITGGLAQTASPAGSAALVGGPSLSSTNDSGGNALVTGGASSASYGSASGSVVVSTPAATTVSSGQAYAAGSISLSVGAGSANGAAQVDGSSVSIAAGAAASGIGGGAANGGNVSVQVGAAAGGGAQGQVILKDGGGSTFVTFAPGGVQVGAPAGGAQGAGTINAAGLFVNGVAVSTGGGGSSYWSRSGTTLSPATPNDVVSVTTNAAYAVSAISTATSSPALLVQSKAAFAGAGGTARYVMQIGDSTPYAGAAGLGAGIALYGAVNGITSSGLAYIDAVSESTAAGNQSGSLNLWGSGPTGTPVKGLTVTSTGVVVSSTDLQVGGTVIVKRASAGNQALDVLVSGDSLYRFGVDASGAVYWGDGTSPLVGLSSNASGVLCCGTPGTVGDASGQVNAAVFQGGQGLFWRSAGTQESIDVRVAGDSFYRLEVNANGATSWGNGTAGLVGLSSNASGVLCCGIPGVVGDTSGQINASTFNASVFQGGQAVLQRSLGTQEALDIRVVGDAFYRIGVNADGAMLWGDGSAAALAALSSNTSGVLCLGGTSGTVGDASGTLNLASMSAATGAITTNKPALSATQTWNNGGVAFQGVILNVANTASAAGSRLLDLQVGGTSLFSVAPTSFGNQVLLVGDENRFVCADNVTAGSSAVIEMVRSRGTLASPGGVLIGDSLGRVWFGGWDSTAAAHGNSATIEGIAAANWTPSSTASQLQFSTVSTGTTPTLWWTLASTGQWQANGAGTIQTTGNSTLTLDAGSGSILTGSGGKIYAPSSTNLLLGADAATQITLTSGGGMQLGSPTGGDLGAGTVNVAGNVSVNDGTVLAPNAKALLTGQTTGVTVCTYTPSADGDYEVSPYVLVTAYTSGAVNVQVTFTDEGGTSRTCNCFFASSAPGSVLTKDVSSANAWSGVSQRIRAKAGTAISVVTAGTFSLTYDVSAAIRQVA